MNKDFLKKLKQSAHHLKPIILVGHKGITEPLVNETNIALDVHECIKIKISGWEKDDRNKMIESLCQQLQATFIQNIGHTFVIYRKSNDSK
ncbi:MAG: YhbY family RNA-binding protein [Gammaproteobacteria bacterium]|jgi:RNA-binding protein|nr:YhbY family RNA-binding protein [Gammaproteobacteria bacterium]